MRRVISSLCAFLLASGAVACGATAFNLDLNAGIQNLNAYEGGPAGFDDGINTWTSYYGYDWARTLQPSGGIPAQANWWGVKVVYGLVSHPPGYVITNQEGFEDPCYPYGLMTDGWKTEVAYPTGKEVIFVCVGDGQSYGVFDVYCYSNEADARFRWEWMAAPTFTGALTVTGMPGYDPENPAFVEGQNYIVFRDVDLDNNSRDPGFEWANLYCSKSISALQFVHRGPQITDGASVAPNLYVWAYDKTDQFAPATSDPNNTLGMTQKDEWLEYDLYVESGDVGFYDVKANVVSPNTDALVGFTLDGGPMQTVSAYSGASSWTDAPQLTDPVRIYLSGDHKLRMIIASQSPFNVTELQFSYSANQTAAGCMDALLMGGTLNPMDFNGNCVVGLADFALFASEWLDCVDPGICP